MEASHSSNSFFKLNILSLFPLESNMIILIGNCLCVVYLIILLNGVTPICHQKERALFLNNLPPQAIQTVLQDP